MDFNRTGLHSTLTSLCQESPSVGRSRRHCRNRRRCAAREALLDRAMGPAASANRRRSCAAAAGRRKAWHSSRAAPTGAVVGTVQAVGRDAGETAVRCCSGRWPSIRRLKSAGIGSALMRQAIAEAGAARPPRHPAGRRRALLLSGSASRPTRPAALAMPGPYERHRLLALELVDGRA